MLSSAELKSVHECVEYCKLCSWDGAAKLYNTLSELGKGVAIRMLTESIPKYHYSRSAQWYIDNLIAAVSNLERGCEVPRKYQDKKTDGKKGHWEESADFQMGMDNEYSISVYLERFKRGGDFTLRFVTGDGLEATIGLIPEKTLKRMLNFLQDSMDREAHTE